MSDCWPRIRPRPPIPHHHPPLGLALGLFSGAYAYALKVFVLQKVRARNFARAWSLVQMSQSVSVLTGVCISSYLSAGHLVSAVSVITGSLSLSLLNLHR